MLILNFTVKMKSDWRISACLSVFLFLLSHSIQQNQTAITAEAVIGVDCAAPVHGAFLCAVMAVLKQPHTLSVL